MVVLMDIGRHQAKEGSQPAAEYSRTDACHHISSTIYWSSGSMCSGSTCVRIIAALIVYYLSRYVHLIFLPLFTLIYMTLDHSHLLKKKHFSKNLVKL